MGGKGKYTVVIITLLLILAAGTVSAQSQVSGGLQGKIKDTDGAALPGVTVTTSSKALVAGKLVTVTDDRGSYRFPSLPVGTYDVQAELSGFQVAKRSGIRVTLSQSLSVDLTMALSTMAESITVTAEAPVLSTVNNTVATNFGTEFLETQPVQRNFYQIIKAAPGVNADISSSGSAMLAYGGTSESQNAFTLDGVNVADAGAGQHWLLPSIQWMQEVQVGGLGAPAEYGGYTGGIINGVTKSGGNETHGGFDIYYEPSSWVSDNDPNSDDEEFEFESYSASVGGRIVQDKLWYFISGEYQNSITTPFGAVDTSDRELPRVLGKLTYQANAQNRLSLMAEYDTVTNERRGIDVYTLPEATSKQDGPNASVSLDWEWLINSQNFTSVRFTTYNGDDDYLPYNGHGTPGRIDEDSGIAWVNQDIQELNSRSISTFDASWNLYKDGIFGGDDQHSFKFGGLYEDAESTDEWRRNGGFTFYDDSSACDSLDAYFANPSCGAYYVEKGWGEYDAHPKFSGVALYAQDSLRINNWTINAGLRYGAYEGGWQSGYGDSKVYDTSFVDPRIGVVWDLKGDARSALKAHWGRYHDKMYTYLFDREASGQAVIPDFDCYWNEDSQQYDDCDTPTYTEARMGSQDHPYVDEALISFEQQLGADMVIGFDLLDRSFGNIVVMDQANEDYELITAHNNPLTGGDLPIWNLLSPQDYVLTSDTNAYRDFQSVTARFEKRYSGKWSARASVVWTDMDGNILKNNGYALEYQDRNGQTNADGRMDYSYSEWEAKVSASYDLPYRFQVSAFYTYLSGWYWTPYVRVRTLDYNARTGRYINLVPRGEEQLPDRNLIDVRLAWSTKLTEALDLNAAVEVFNATNSDTVTSIDDYYGDYRLSTGKFTKRANYGNATGIEKPREIRASLRLTF
ncbi:MAG: TonB-dependent receptor [Thermoanaerobaculia bacterium]|jgi:hypothetical protein